MAGLVVFPTFFSLSLSFVIRSWWYAPQSALGLVLLAVYSFSIFGYKECNQFDFDIDHLVMSMCKVISCVVEKGYLIWPVHSLGRIQLTFVPLHFILQGQTFLLFWVSLDFLLLHSNSQCWILFLVLVLGSLLGLHRTDQLQLLWHWW